SKLMRHSVEGDERAADLSVLIASANGGFQIAGRDAPARLFERRKCATDSHRDHEADEERDEGRRQGDASGAGAHEADVLGEDLAIEITDEVDRARPIGVFKARDKLAVALGLRGELEDGSAYLP